MSERTTAQRPCADARAVEVRALTYQDLPHVMAVERRVFPTPWSLAMFVLELSKQSGVCLAATVPAGEAAGEDGEHQQRGLASAMLAELYRRVGDSHARFTLEVRRSNDVAIHLYEREGFRAAGMRRRYYQDNGEDALVMWRTPATLTGSLGDVPNPGEVGPV